MKPLPDLPIAISLIAERYFLFSADVVSYLRQEHHICGVLIGSIPQIPQQNVFLGLPLELMPEEAQLLVDKNIAYIVDDVRAHDEGLCNLERNRRQGYLTSLRQAGEKAARSQADFRGQKKEQALKKRGLTLASADGEPAEMFGGSQGNDVLTAARGHNDADDAEDVGQTTSLLAPPTLPLNPTNSKTLTKEIQSSALALTPATSHLLLPLPPAPPPSGSTLSPPRTLPVQPPSYSLFAHLHSRGYFLSPGLRFGCQYVVYPGDPLRFHSHFLAVGVEWEQEIDLMDLVGGGRLGTGVKKGFLIGGQEPGENGGGVRTFSVEWAVM